MKVNAIRSVAFLASVTVLLFFFGSGKSYLIVGPVLTIFVWVYERLILRKFADNIFAMTFLLSIQFSIIASSFIFFPSIEGKLDAGIKTFLFSFLVFFLGLKILRKIKSETKISCDEK